MTTIDEVLIELDSIVEICSREQICDGYFAVLYRLVTRRIKEGIENDEFMDNKRMEQLDVLFAKRYIDAFHAYRKEKPVSSSWNESFDAGKESRYVVLQHLFLGINAHINLDLGVAASETMAGKDLYGIKKDFDSINAILESLVDGVKANIGKVSPVFWWLIGFTRGRDELLLNFSIQIARDGAWNFAGEVHHSSDRDRLILERDANIARLARRLTNPGKWLGFLLKLIRYGEFKSPDAIMQRLETIA
jgi:hypothetical protein